MTEKEGKTLSKVAEELNELNKTASYGNRIHNKILMYIYEDIKGYLPNNVIFNENKPGRRFSAFDDMVKADDCLVLGPSETGEFEKKLSNHFNNVTCVDASSEIIERLKDKLPDYTLINSLFESLRFDRKFDYIFALHILEHVEYPHILLNLLKFWLKDKAKVVIAVPNANSLHRLLGMEMGILKKQTDLSDSDMKIGHKRVYNMFSLRKDIDRAGFYVATTFGVFLKPLNNMFMEKLSDDQIDGFYKLGKNSLMHNCADIIMIVKEKVFENDTMPD